MSSRLELSTRAFPQSLFSSDEHPSTPHNRRARFTRTHQPHRTPRALVLVMADDLSNLGTCAFDLAVRAGAVSLTPNVIAHAFFSRPRGCPTPAGWVSTRCPGTRAMREPAANATRSVTYTGFCEYDSPRCPTVARADAGHRRGALFCWGAAPSIRRRSAIPRWGRPSPPADGTARPPIGGCRCRRASDRCRPSLAGRVPGSAWTLPRVPAPPLALRPTFFLPKRTRADAHFAFPFRFAFCRTQLDFADDDERPLKKSSRRIP